MPSLNEMLAAKAKAAPPEKPAPAPVMEAPARGGLRLTEDMVPGCDSGGGAPSIPLELMHLLAPEEGRSLGRVAGEGTPEVGGRPTSPDPRWDWMLESLDRDLCVWVEPGTTGHAWLAVERRGVADPLVLLLRLPVSSRARPRDPF
jgi:hypothetical protein